MTFDPDGLGRSKQDLAETIRALRKRAGLSGERLARCCNMSQSKISKIETGKITPSLTDVECILLALNAPRKPSVRLPRWQGWPLPSGRTSARPGEGESSSDRRN